MTVLLSGIHIPLLAHFGGVYFRGVIDWYQSQGYREPALVENTKCLHRFAISSDNASFAVTYTSVSFDLNGPSSWGILLINTGELLEMDSYEEVAQQGQAHPLSPTYIPDPIELDEHVPVYVPEPKHPEYHAPSDDDIQVEDQPYADDALSTAESPGYIAESDSMEEDTDEDSIDYPDEPEDGEEDDDKDPKEDPEEDPSKEHKPEDDDDNDDTNDKDEEPTKDEEEEEYLDLAYSSVVPIVDHVPSAGDTETFKTDESAPTPRSPQTRVRIAEHATAPILPTSHTYDQAPLGHRAAMIPESSAAARAPRRQYDFVDTVMAGQGLIRSPGHDASEHRMMTSIKEVNLKVSYQRQVHRQKSEDFYIQLHDAQTDRRDIRLEIDVVRG
ncbi:hypothetical protein Tco_1010209 [Tanacetum coccineum]